MGREEAHRIKNLDLEQLIASLERREMPLPFEIGSFIVLEVAESQCERPCVVDAVDVSLSDAGRVLTSSTARHADDQEASRSAVALLRRVLAVAETETPPALMELVERGPSGGWSLHALHDDLEALLVPLNRAAVRRVLARMVRDARRPASVPSPGSPAAASEPPDADPAPPQAPERAALPSAEALDARFDAWIAREAQAGGRKPSEPSLEAQEVDGLEEASAFGPGRARWLLGLLILAMVLLVLLGVRQGALFATRATSGRATSPPVHADASAPDAAGIERRDVREHARDARMQTGTVVLHSDPSGAQVLLDLGQAPLEVRGLAVGVAHELLGVIEGRAPARAVVPADAEWRRAGYVPRFDLELSFPKSSVDAGAAALGATRLPDELGHPTGERGVVAVHSRPRGARIYRLMGFTPEARIEGLPTRRVAHVLLHHPAGGTRDIVIEPSRWRRDGGTDTLRIDVAMSP